MKTAFLAVLLASVAVPCAAANIEIKGNTIRIIGTVELGDDAVFESKAQPFYQAMVVHLHSKGGMTTPALKIGRFIRQRGWDTTVEYTCYSSCAWLWLAGIRHFKTASAEIAFHSASDVRTGAISTASNHAVTDYLSELGYGPEVARFTTTAPPNSMVLLSDHNAKRLGIQVSIVPPTIPRQTFGNVDLDKRPSLPKVSTPRFHPTLTDEVKLMAERLRQRP